VKKDLLEIASLKEVIGQAIIYMNQGYIPLLVVITGKFDPQLREMLVTAMAGREGLEILEVPYPIDSAAIATQNALPVPAPSS